MQINKVGNIQFRLWYIFPKMATAFPPVLYTPLQCDFCHSSPPRGEVYFLPLVSRPALKLAGPETWPTEAAEMTLGPSIKRPCGFCLLIWDPESPGTEAQAVLTGRPCGRTSPQTRHWGSSVSVPHNTIQNRDKTSQLRPSQIAGPLNCEQIKWLPFVNKIYGNLLCSNRRLWHRWSIKPKIHSLKKTNHIGKPLTRRIKEKVTSSQYEKQKGGMSTEITDIKEITTEILYKIYLK